MSGFGAVVTLRSAGDPTHSRPLLVFTFCRLEDRPPAVGQGRFQFRGRPQSEPPPVPVVAVGVEVVPTFQAHIQEPAGADHTKELAEHPVHLAGWGVNEGSIGPDRVEAFSTVGERGEAGLGDSSAGVERLCQLTFGNVGAHHLYT
jgi:hypothetical protein